jgi:hypothetical protein
MAIGSYVISIQPPDFIFVVHKAFFCKGLEAFKGAATREKKTPQANANPELAVF